MNLPPHASVLLQSQLHNENVWLQFDKPLALIVANSPQDISACLAQLQQRQREGYYLAGYLAYEAAAGLNPAMATALQAGRSELVLPAYPLLWFGVYQAPRVVDIKALQAEMQTPTQWNLAWQTDISLTEYARCLKRIKEEIASGNTYQVNYSFRMLSRFVDDPFSFFLKLQRAQASRFSAYINLGDKHICSATPELFFMLQNGKLLARPMKGTINRGLHAAQDERRSSWLQNSEKNRAENLMIVDMIRNDLGQVAEAGSVAVEALFSIETYPTVLQMTSTVSARSTHSVFEILQHMFPCASITGAPKINTMKIIAELESSPRGIYTGSIGYITPDGDAQFNVAIRTVLVDEQRQEASYGVGGGIVWDSTIEDEYRECRIKAEILMREPPELKLLEAMRMEASGEVYLLEEHLQRLQEACNYFGFAFQEQKIRELIKTTQRSYKGDAHKLRLLVDAEGVPEMFAVFLGSRLHYRVALSAKQHNTQSRFIYHKTTNRGFYEDLLEEHQVDDVIIVNTDDQITESCSANVVIVKEGRKLTPALDCGLLNGTLRKKLLASGEIAEAIITREDFLRAEEIYLINSVRGWMRLELGENGLYTIIQERLVI